MEVIEDKLWSILRLAHSDELNPTSLEYLKVGLGGVFAKYVYDKDLSHFQFTKWLKADIEYKRVDSGKLLKNLSMIYYHHRDFDVAFTLRELKINMMQEVTNKEDIAQDYYVLAKWFFEKNSHKKALKNIVKGVECIDDIQLSKSGLKLFIESLIMKVQLKMILKYEKNDIDAELSGIYKLIEDEMKILDTQDIEKLYVWLHDLVISQSMDQKDYQKVITVGKKAVDLIDNKNVKLNTMLEYYLYEKLGYAYLFMKDYENAIVISRRALGLKKDLVSIPLYSVLVILVESYVAQKEYDEALRYAHDANSYVNNSVEKLKYIYEMLSKIYNLKGDIKSASEYAQKFKHLNEGIKQIV